jgi:hypothetical protein
MASDFDHLSTLNRSIIVKRDVNDCLATKQLPPVDVVAKKT